MDQLESALERLRPKLILAFQFNLKDLADLMHGEGFLSDSDHQTVTAVASLHNESDKAGIMVKSLINKVKINGEHYQTFLKLVQPERRKYDDVVLLLTSGVSMTSEPVPVNNNSEGVQERNRTSGIINGKQPFILHCTDCGELACQHCSLNNHEDHNYKLIKKASPETKMKQLKEKELLEVRLEQLTKARDKIRTTILEVENQQLASVNNIHTEIKELHDILDQREQKLVKDVTNIAQQKVHNLFQQVKSLTQDIVELRCLVDFTERCVSLSIDNELVSMDTEMRKTIHQKVQESGERLEPVEEADIAVDIRCADALRQLCLTQANIAIAIDPAKCRVKLPALTEVGITYVATLATTLCSDGFNYKKYEVSSHIKSLYNEVTTNCAIKEDEPGTYSIQYTPTVRGRHELTVLINGQHVAGSPFPVYVSIHPTQLGEPVKIWTEIHQPYTITGNSKREILVVLRCGDIVKFDSKRNRRDLIKECDKGVHYIACDNKDIIYCIGGNNIMTCDDNVDNIQIKLENESYLSSLAITDEKLIDSDEKFIVAEVNSIKVYNKQLQYLATFEHNNVNMNIVDVSVDIHQKLYVADKKGKCCHIFKDRKHICSFKSSLKCPRGLCVHHQYVYVADVSGHCIRVFTTDGEYVTSFGQSGQERGQFRWPSFIYVDEDGFIYVTDMDNNRIQCF